MAEQKMHELPKRRHKIKQKHKEENFTIREKNARNYFLDASESM